MTEQTKQVKRLEAKLERVFQRMHKVVTEIMDSDLDVAEKAELYNIFCEFRADYQDIAEREHPYLKAPSTRVKPLVPP